MERKYVNLTPVKHTRDGYCGWIDDRTRMENLFTGNCDVPWQYRVVTQDGQRKVAPQEDLEIDYDTAQFPPDNVRERYAETREGQSDLNALGYSLSSMAAADRFKLLHDCAVPILGVNKVLRCLCDIIWRKVGRGSMATLSRYENALKQWMDDLEQILNTCQWENNKDVEQETLSYVISIKERMMKLFQFCGEISIEVMKEKIKKS